VLPAALARRWARTWDQYARASSRARCCRRPPRRATLPSPGPAGSRTGGRRPAGRPRRARAAPPAGPCARRRSTPACATPRRCSGSRSTVDSGYTSRNAAPSPGSGAGPPLPRTRHPCLRPHRVAGDRLVPRRHRRHRPAPGYPLDRGKLPAVLGRADQLGELVDEVVQFGDLPVLRGHPRRDNAWPGSLVTAPIVGACTDSTEGHGAPPRTPALTPEVAGTIFGPGGWLPGSRHPPVARSSRRDATPPPRAQGGRTCLALAPTARPAGARPIDGGAANPGLWLATAR
jgi:hypothetical protein